jgi:hypothetical protein
MIAWERRLGSLGERFSEQRATRAFNGEDKDLIAIVADGLANNVATAFPTHKVENDLVRRIRCHVYLKRSTYEDDRTTAELNGE